MFTTLRFGRLASPLFNSTFPGAFALFKFEVIRHTTLVEIALRLKMSFWTTTHGWRSAGDEPDAGAKLNPVDLSLFDLRHHASFKRGRTLFLIFFSRRFSAGSAPLAYALFSRTNISSCRCRCRNSSTANEKSPLRLNPITRAVLSASWSRLSSMEIAVFIGYR